MSVVRMWALATREVLSTKHAYLAAPSKAVQPNKHALLYLSTPSICSLCLPCAAHLSTAAAANKELSYQRAAASYLSSLDKGSAETE